MLALFHFNIIAEILGNTEKCSPFKILF